MASKTTKDCIKKRNTFHLISILLWLGTAATLVFCALNVGVSANSDIATFILSLSMTLLIAIILTLIIKDKMRNTIWMTSVIIASILYKEVGMYIVFALWAIDEFILHALYLKYKNLKVINEEIDKRLDYE